MPTRLFRIYLFSWLSLMFSSPRQTQVKTRLSVVELLITLKPCSQYWIHPLDTTFVVWTNIVSRVLRLALATHRGNASLRVRQWSRHWPFNGVLNVQGQLMIAPQLIKQVCQSDWWPKLCLPVLRATEHSFPLLTFVIISIVVFLDTFHFTIKEVLSPSFRTHGIFCLLYDMRSFGVSISWTISLTFTATFCTYTCGLVYSLPRTHSRLGSTYFVTYTPWRPFEYQRTLHWVFPTFWVQVLSPSEFFCPQVSLSLSSSQVVIYPDFLNTYNPQKWILICSPCLLQPHWHQSLNTLALLSS